MNLDTSPATEARTQWRSSSRPSPTTSAISFGTPRNAEEASKLLSHAERLLRDSRMTGNHVSQLTRYLGANSAAWTPDNRERLRSVLSGLGEDVIESVVAALNRLPRTDILDQGELLLRSLPREAVPSLRRVLDNGGIAPGVRVAILRAAARLDEGTSLPTLQAALNDPDSELRDAAALLLGEIGGAGGRAVLERRLQSETDNLVRASLQEALDSLQP